MPEKLGKAERVENVSLNEDSKVLKITGVPSKAKTVTIFCRGSN